MNIGVDEETVTNSLDELLEAGDHTGRPFNVLVGSNMGNRTLLLSAPMMTFYEISDVANRANLDAFYFISEACTQCAESTRSVKLLLTW